MMGMRQCQSIPEPDPTLPTQARQGMHEVRFILWATAFGLVQYLDLGGEIRDSVSGRLPNCSDWTADGGHAPKQPPLITGIGDHELNRPRLHRIVAAPNVMDRLFEHL